MTAVDKAKRPLVVASVVAGMFMIAMEATIVAPAMPGIAAQFGDVHLYSWVFGSFLLTQTATTVVFGKLSDLYGRKPVLLVGIAIFLVGSVLCGFAWSMPSLIAFRLIQGIGAGSIQPVGITVVGDLYPANERGKVQGYLASIWGVSSVLGPLAGGYIVSHTSWAWIFWINVPVGLASAAGFVAFLHENVARQRRSIDAIGAALFTVAVAALMVALTEIGTANVRAALAAALIVAVSSALFVAQEGRAKDPMLALGLWTHRPIATANAATLLSGMVIIGLTTFLPMYVQGVLNGTPLVAGFALTMMVLGWPVGATLGAKIFTRIGLRPTLLLGAALIPLGTTAFLFLDPGSSPALAGGGSLLTGFGMGFLSTAAIVIVQDSVGWAERGAATASNIFARNLGSTLGATVLGAVLNLSLAHGPARGAVDADDLRALLDKGSAALGSEATRAALNHALHLTFWAVFAVSVLTLLLALLVPRVAIGAAPREAPAE